MPLTKSQEALLSYYKLNSNESYRTIGKHFGVSHEAVRKKLKQLYDKGYLNIVNGKYEVKL
jgi:predicted ArsR family transcriptional regulator